MKDEALIHLRVPAATKARWVRESRASGMRLTDWIIEKVDKIMTKKYQIADQNNGPFGEIYETEAAAEAALDDLVSELLPTACEEVKLQEEQEADRHYRDPKSFTEEELHRLAEARIRDFHHIIDAETGDTV